MPVMIFRVDSEAAAAPVDLTSFVVVGTGSRVCGFPVAHVVETMRPLPLTPFIGSPEFVKGVAVIRGQATPVVDLGALLGGRDTDAARRYLTLRLDRGHLALAVEEVLGIRNLPGSVFHALPPLLGGLEDALVERLGVLDSKLLLVLRASRILPAEAWQHVMPEGAP